MSRNGAWRALIVRSAVLLTLANLGLWVDRGFADEARFVEAATDVLEQRSMREALAEAIVREALADFPALYRLGGGAAERAVADLLATPAMRATLQVIAMHLHVLLVSDERPAFVITSRLLQAIALAIALVAPLQAATLTLDGRTIQVELFARDDIPSYERYIDVARLGGLTAGLLALALLALAVLAAADRPRALPRVAYALMAAAVLSLLIVAPLRRVVTFRIDDTAARTIVTGVHGELAPLLVGQSVALLIAGILLWLAGMLTRPRAAESPGAPTTAP
ncbi:MAG TPA: hypothetical protein VMM78_10450 [Thermomicrobiales bacterium]|nr:hypothetical protein [Thermomicrobiales bacterium]